MAEKSELNWAFDVKPTHAKHLAKLWLSNEPANALAKLTGKWRPAASAFPYPDQESGTLSPAWNADGTPNCTFKGMATDGMGDGRALADEDGAQVAAFGSVVAPGFSEANTNAAFSAENAQLEAGRAGTAVGVGEAAAIRAEAARTAERDPLLEQMMAEERERAELAAREGAGSAAGASAKAAARDARGFKEPADAEAHAMPASWRSCATASREMTAPKGGRGEPARSPSSPVFWNGIMHRSHLISS